MHKILVFLLLFLGLHLSAQKLAEPAQAVLAKVKVVKVTDADGCWVQYPDGRKQKYRWCGIDAPETKNGIICAAQPHSYVSRDSVRALILGKYVYIDTLPQGRVARSYDRTIADFYSTDSVPVFLNLYVVQKGWAWGLENTKRVNPELNAQLLEATEVARKERRGLFGVYYKGKYVKPVLPATWRRKYRCSEQTKTVVGS